MRPKHQVSILALFVLAIAFLPARTFAEDAIVVNTRPLPEGSPSTLLVRAFVGSTELSTSTSPATVWLDRRIAGQTPFALSSLSNGTYYVGVSAEGYASRETKLRVADATAYEIVFHLERSTGRLLVTVDPPDAELSVDGTGVFPGLLRLPSGFREIRARRFGYAAVTTSVLVPRDGIATAKIVLSPAPFAVSAFRAVHSVFNPANSGPFGAALISFYVSAPGSAGLSILDEDGVVVFTKDFPSFSTWEQSFAWNGSDSFGNALPDGRYRARLETTPATSTAELELAIDSSLVIRPFGSHGGLPGLALLPIPLPAPRGFGSFDATIAGDTLANAAFSTDIQISTGTVSLGFYAGEDFEAKGAFDFGIALPIRGGLGSGAGATLTLGGDSAGRAIGRVSFVLPLFSALASGGSARTPALFVGLAPGMSLSTDIPPSAVGLDLELAGGAALASDSWLVGASAKATYGDLFAASPGFRGCDTALEARLVFPRSPLVLELEAGLSYASDFSPQAPWGLIGLCLWF